MGCIVRLGRVFLTFLKVFLLLVVTAMIRFQIPELRYDLGSKTPIQVASPNDLSVERFASSTFAAVHGKPDLTKAATFAMHGVPFTYFLLEGYGPKLVVRTPEEVSEEWNQIDKHLGRLRPYHRMPFSRSVRAGFKTHFGMEIPEDALFLGRDDVPRLSGWSVGAVIFAGTLWCVLAYVFFLRGLLDKGKPGPSQASQTASDL